MNETVWRLVTATAERSPANVDHISITLLSEHVEYIVSVTAAKKMSNSDMANALRAACNYILRASGAEMLQGTREATPEEGKGQLNG